MIEKLRLAKSAHALNDVVAEHNRRMFKEAGITVVNMISSPGSGKTSLLEALARRMHRTLLVITGDIQTQLDKERIEKAGAQAIQIETRGSCHLSAAMINAVVKGLSFSGLELLVIENVGNCVPVFLRPWRTREDCRAVGRRRRREADQVSHPVHPGRRRGDQQDRPVAICQFRHGPRAQRRQKVEARRGDLQDVVRYRGRDRRAVVLSWKPAVSRPLTGAGPPLSPRKPLAP